MSSIIVSLCTCRYLAFKLQVMLLQARDPLFSGFNSAQEICSVIPTDYHAPVLKSCTVINHYLQNHASISELPESVTELVQLVFQRIEDELIHTFRKETGILFPCIHQQHVQSAHLQPKVIETMISVHQVLIALFRKPRELMNHYIAKPDWSKEFKDCIHEMFLLETYVFRWIQFEQSVLYPQLIRIIKTGKE